MQKNASIMQKIFPFSQKHFHLDAKKGKLHIVKRTLFKKNAFDIDLYTINTNVEKAKKYAIFWLLFAITISTYLIIYISAIMLGDPLKLAGSMQFYNGVNIVLLLAAVVSWKQYFAKSYHVIIYFNKFNNTPSFTLHISKPDQAKYDEFIKSLNSAIIYFSKTQTLRAIFNDIPTHILVRELGVSYIDELTSRGVDVQAVLLFLQRRIMRDMSSISTAQGVSSPLIN